MSDFSQCQRSVGSSTVHPLACVVVCNSEHVFGDHCSRKLLEQLDEHVDRRDCERWVTAGVAMADQARCKFELDLEVQLQACNHLTLRLLQDN